VERKKCKNCTDGTIKVGREFAECGECVGKGFTEKPCPRCKGSRMGPGVVPCGECPKGEKMEQKERM
jgi:hypothetical protein